ncbi:hypothetical protein Oweho_1443 [Owenweeksia hongkongensis DSM 17368]|uniref:XRE family transcriptional regulator n=1 Tax=Owenweeksia hongkongensis (strain DSM 17368 / CIP 108786 / JCM 12287 / NRRL B-23963 / UST20020801) TaxID=926562 RepID=G8R871_OWEHD|nr:hypothetical protein Oweho_1443 [Owenweeksia hongkongensis DSM 17368]
MTNQEQFELKLKELRLKAGLSKGCFANKSEIDQTYNEH